MKIVINTAHQHFGGAVQVALSFIRECRAFPGNEYHVWVGPGVGKSLNTEEFPGNFTYYNFNFGKIGFKTIRQIQQELSSIEKEIQPDAIISTSGPSYYQSDAPQVIGFNLPLYIYPESPYAKELPLNKKMKLRLKKQAHFYYFKRDASAYVTQTEDVNHRVQKALGTDRVYTVTNTCSRFYLEKKKFPPKLPPKGSGTIRFLTLSSWYPHKNLEFIPDVTSVLQRRGIENVEFVLTLKDSDFQEQIGSHPKIHNVGSVLPEEGPSLYQECDGMFLPTLAECFSASYPEAMAMEKPIVTTDLGFARSICGDAALYFEAKNAKSAADQIEALIKDQELQEILIKNGEKQLQIFDTPEERARKYLEICEEVAREG